LVLNDVCNNTVSIRTDCEDLSNGIALQGLLAILAYYRRIIREFYTIFLSKRDELEAVKRLLATKTTQEFGNSYKHLELLMIHVLKPVAHKLVDEILYTIERINNNNANVDTAALIVFIVILVLAIPFFILPYVNKVRNDVRCLMINRCLRFIMC